jgi:hypothetical protein
MDLFRSTNVIDNKIIINNVILKDEVFLPQNNKIMRKQLYLLFFSIPLHLFSQGYFTQPETSFARNPIEKITDLIFVSTPISDLQASIDACRASNPKSIIRITLKGQFSITNSPIQLSDSMLLIFNNATISAATSATAPALLSITNAQYVGVTAVGTSLLNGNGLNITGISVTNSGKTHIDNLSIQNCKIGGVYYSGQGANVYADAGSVTRCNIKDCTAFGVYFSNSFNFICTDNLIEKSNIGISVNSNNSAVSNNNISSCGNGILQTGQFNVLTNNSIDNCTTGFYLNNLAADLLVSYNKISNNTTAFNLNCGATRIYYNKLSGNTVAITGKGSNTTNLICNKGLTITEATGKGCFYFNPPLIGNQHVELVKIGKTRVDITLTGGNLTSVRTALANAHSASPTAVVVAHLNGNFYTDSANDSLLVREDECILLNGTIGNLAGQTKTVVCFNESNIFSSFSGGKIDGKKLNGANTLLTVSGSPNVVLDSIKVVNSAVMGQGITKRSGSNPTYIRACSFDSIGARSIWVLGASRLYAFENKSTNARYDGVDLDAFSSYSVIVNNDFANQTRNGVYIEEGSSNNIILHNVCRANSRGIDIGNLAVANLHTSKNLIAHNTCIGNIRGIMLSAASADRSTIDNVIFNNVCSNNTDVGLGGLYTYNPARTTNNYLAMNSLFANTNGNYASNRDYSLNMDWNILLPTILNIEQTILNKQTPLGFKYSFVGGELIVNIESDYPMMRIALRDITGKQLVSINGVAGNNKLTTNGYSSGVYFLQISSTNSSVVTKIIKP